MRFLAALRFDILFQFRHGFYAVYAIVTIMYVALLKLLPDEVVASLLPVILFTDPAMLGFIFIGAIVLLEKEEGTVQSLFVTPLRLREYFGARLLSLGLISLLTTVAIALAVRGVRFWPHLLIPGVLLTAGLFTLLGFAVAARAGSFNEFLLGAVLVIVLACVPLLDHFGLVRSVFFYLFPSQASLVLIRGAFSGASVLQQLYALVYLGLWLGLAWRLAVREFSGGVIARIGEA